METTTIVQLLIFTHAGLGGIALLSGGIALASRKGQTVHKKAGIVFFYAMLLSTLLALMIAVSPHHENAFLFSIGIFSIYFILSGYRSLNYKKKEFELRMDKLISWIMLLTGITMILYPILLLKKVNFVLLIFGAIGLIFGIRDLILYRNKKRLKENWLGLHLGKMTGGYIAAVSAFFVVNNILPGVWNWFTPGIIGGIFIGFWMRKLTEKTSIKTN